MRQSISYAVTVCNELVEIQRLINVLLEYKQKGDEIVVLYDAKNGDPEVEMYLRSHSVNAEFNWHKSEFEGDFAVWKNRLTRFCSNKYIFQLDADEIPSNTLMDSLDTLLKYDLDVYFLPRINTVEGLTEGHIKKWGWQVNSKGWVNYPDLQGRLYKNDPEIYWQGKVHERLTGYRTYTTFNNEEVALLHPKTIERQERQNNYYNML